MTIWEVVENEINKNTHTDFRIINRKPVSGGDISESYCISDGTSRYFVKCNDAIFVGMFEAEANGLKALEQASQFKVPRMIAYGVAENQCYLILEYLDITNRISPKLLGEQLAKLHTATNSQFGFYEDNFIGKTKQLNPWSDDWGEFFTHQRIGFQISLLEEKGSSLHSKKEVIDFLSVLPEYLNKHQPTASLVHGDLWQGNYGFTEGQAVLYDPACYFADHEVDLAMLELFGNPGEDFFKVYQDEFGIKQGYSVRKKIYNLYHILNHANLFGGSYEQQAYEMVKAILTRF